MLKSSFQHRLISLIILGISLFILGYVMGGRTSVYFDSAGAHPLDENPHELSITQPLDFTKLLIDASCCEVRVKRGDALRVEARYVDGTTPEYTLENSVLHLFDNGGHEQKFRFNIGYQPVSNTLTVTLPASLTLDAFDANCSLGSITIEDVQAREMHINAQLGDVNATGSFSGDTTMRSHMGDVVVSGKLADANLLQSDLGRVVFKGELTGDTRVVSKLGSASITTSLKRSEYLLSTDLSLGNVRNNSSELNPASAPNSLDVRAELGDIELKFGK